VFRPHPHRPCRPVWSGDDGVWIGVVEEMRTCVRARGRLGSAARSSHSSRTAVLQANWAHPVRKFCGPVPTDSPPKTCDSDYRTLSPMLTATWAVRHAEEPRHACAGSLRLHTTGLRDAQKQTGSGKPSCRARRSSSRLPSPATRPTDPLVARVARCSTKLCAGALNANGKVGLRL
jgi:hypothetical protein